MLNYTDLIVNKDYLIVIRGKRNKYITCILLDMTLGRCFWRSEDGKEFNTDMFNTKHIVVREVL